MMRRKARLVMLKGLLHKPRHSGRYDWHIQQRCVPHGTRPVRQVHINTETGERWMEQIQCNTRPVFLGHLYPVKLKSGATKGQPCKRSC